MSWASPPPVLPCPSSENSSSWWTTTHILLISILSSHPASSSCLSNAPRTCMLESVPVILPSQTECRWCNHLSSKQDGIDQAGKGWLLIPLRPLDPPLALLSCFNLAGMTTAHDTKKSYPECQEKFGAAKWNHRPTTSLEVRARSLGGPFCLLGRKALCLAPEVAPQSQVFIVLTNTYPGSV